MVLSLPNVTFKKFGAWGAPGILSRALKLNETWKIIGKLKARDNKALIRIAFSGRPRDRIPFPVELDVIAVHVH